MPIYEYKCNECGNVFEQLVFSSDSDECVCPSCGEGNTCKLMSCFSCGSSSGTGDLGSDLSAGCSTPTGGFS
jgi:putative FmdB family regulatory protein